MIKIFHVLSFCYFISVALTQVQVPTSVIVVTPTTPLQSSSASFQYPRTTETLVVNVIDTIVVEWQSNFAQSAFLYLWCDNGVPGAPNNRKCKPCLDPTRARYIITNVHLAGAHFQVNTTGTSEISPSSYVDKVKQDWTRPYACHLDLTYEDVYYKGISGPGINVTSFANQEITRTYAYLNTVPPLSPSTMSSGTTMSNTINTSSSPTSNTASQPADSDDKNTGLSAGAAAGIAIGATMGFIALAVLGFMVWRKRKVDKSPPMVHRNDLSMHHDEFFASQSGYKNAYGHQSILAELEPHSTQELPLQGEPQELSGSCIVGSNHNR
jgi:hypothetical protein